MANLLKISVLFILSLFLSCSNTGKTNTSGQKQTGDTVNKWIIVQQGSQCAVNKASQILIKTSDGLIAEWNKAFSGMDMKPDIPQVDFTKSWVVAAYMGEKNKGGYEVGIHSVQTGNDSLIISVSHIIPGPNCISSMDIEYPFVFAEIDKSPALKTVFSVTEVIKECN